MIESIHGQGVRLNLDAYMPLNAYPGGKQLWHPDYQDFILNWQPANLGSYLAKATWERGDPDHVVFMYIDEDGQEMASVSRQLRSGDIPEDEMAEFESSLKDFQALGQRSDIDPDKSYAARNFRLPNRASEPELWRVYTSRGRKRLLVLWGCERVSGAPIPPPPDNGFRRDVPVWPVSPKLLGVGAAGFLALLLLLAVLCAVFKIGICADLNPITETRSATDHADDARRPEDAKRADDARRPEDAKRADDAGRPKDAKRADDAGRPEDAKRTDDAGRPEDAKRADDAGRPEDAKRADDAGRPKDTKRADDAGRPEDAKRADDAGRPKDTKRADDAGRPKDTKRTDDAGRPKDTKRPEDAKRADDAGRPKDAQRADDAKRIEDQKRAEDPRRTEAPAVAVQGDVSADYTLVNDGSEASASGKVTVRLRLQPKLGRAPDLRGAAWRIRETRVTAAGKTASFRLKPSTDAYTLEITNGGVTRSHKVTIGLTPKVDVETAPNGE